MNIKDIQYYILLSETKNFSDVAKYYHVSQPTILAALKRLENEFGTQLVVRGNPQQAIALTRTGEQLLAHAREIADHYQLAKIDIQNSQNHQLVVGMPPIIETNYFPRIAEELPANVLMAIHTVEEGSIAALKDLKSGQLDLSFLGYIEEITDPTIDVYQIDQQPFTILVPTASELAKRTSVSFQELKSHPFVLFKDSFVHDRVFRQLASASHVRPKVVFRTNAAQSILNMVAHGVGLGFLTSAIEVSDPRVNRIRLADTDLPAFKIGLAFRRHTVFGEHLEPIVNQLREIIQRNHKPGRIGNQSSHGRT